MPAVLQFNRPKAEGVLTQAAAYLGIEGGFDGFCAYVDELNASLGIPKTLTELGVADPDLDTLVRDALNDPSTGGNPVEMTAENTRALLEALL
jgi:4-hydroxybutyrate dehydrogenase